MKDPRQYKGQKVVVLGMARSGQAVAQVFHQYGANVIVNDKKERDQCPEADYLQALGISVLCGGHPNDLIDEDTALVIKNPGIPYSIAPVQKAISAGVEIVTEVEVAYYLCAAPIIGITGSNGKTTTTTWIGHMLEKEGLQPIVAGNIGIPLCEAAAEAKPEQWVIAELSSFQLKGTAAFRPKIAVLLNLYATHLDYHGTMEDYEHSKYKLVENQSKADVTILNRDVPAFVSLSKTLSSQIVWFSRKQEVERGMWVRFEEEADDGMIVYRDAQKVDTPILPMKEIALKGKHNVENALAAAAAAAEAGVSLDVIREQLRSFQGVEHRQEFIGERRGIAFYNDSKATNPASTIRALDAFEHKVILIAGGLDRGMEYDELIPWFEQKVKGIVTLGETRHKLNEAAQTAGIQHIQTVDLGKEHAEQAIRSAVQYALDMAEKGDIVLLSPACASWDMFSTYEQRGRIFKETVHNL